ncbi:metal-dependent hydrolase [Halococcus dombrowskii]|uniref:Metal-dependent hydrolase n=1 Tax=Halococcus dombrowskii TaxID=179637 RepID=A0AAV3SDC9_HALDO|nr:metal-dependent hydrolase [Halococcus dombrowskii]UOO95020.1 metal-dependent hydrolase [Halococcus dombrowskii]
MLPWGHLAFGYLLVSALVRVVPDWEMDRTTVLLVLLGTQFPDLVDKPLAWTFHVLPSGRSLAHSLFALVAVCALVGYYYRRRGRPDLGVAFTVGYGSHLIGDGYGYLLSGEYTYLSSLGWPLLPPPPFGDEGTFLTHIPEFAFTPGLLAQVTLLAILYVVWIEDGAPGRELFDR